MVIYPPNALQSRHDLPDLHFATEYNRLKLMGLDVVVIDTDDLDDPYVWKPLKDTTDVLIYRGWMKNGTEYQRMVKSAAKAGYDFLTSPLTYIGAHELPNWYAAFYPFTPRTYTCWKDDIGRAAKMTRDYFTGPVFVKDFVKSEPTACFITDPQDHFEVTFTLTTLRELRGIFFETGFVMREFENYFPGEMRTWWVGGEMVAQESRNGQTLNFELPKGFKESMDYSNLYFVTADFRLRTDGVWRLIEIGDGQVSDMHPDSVPGVFGALVR